MCAQSAKVIVGDKIWDSYFTFCVERDPWSKTQSHYKMLLLRGKRGLRSFDEYLDKTDCKNYYQYTDSTGVGIVDRVLDYNQLDSQLGEVLAGLNVPYNGSLDVRAKDYSKEKLSTGVSKLSQKQRSKICKDYAEEISFMGYSLSIDE